MQELDSQFFDHRIAGWVGIDARTMPGDKTGDVQVLAGEHGNMTHDAVMSAHQVVAAHLPTQAVQAMQQCPWRFVKQAVHDGVAPATAEPCDMYLHTVGEDFVGAMRHFVTVAHTAHEPPVIDLQHVDIDLVVSYLLQVLHAVDDGIEYTQPAIDVTLE